MKVAASQSVVNNKTTLQDQFDSSFMVTKMNGEVYFNSIKAQCHS